MPSKLGTSFTSLALADMTASSLMCAKGTPLFTPRAARLPHRRPPPLRQRRRPGPHDVVRLRCSRRQRLLSPSVDLHRFDDADGLFLVASSVLAVHAASGSIPRASTSTASTAPTARSSWRRPSQLFTPPAARFPGRQPPPLRRRRRLDPLDDTRPRCSRRQRLDSPSVDRHRFDNADGLIPTASSVTIVHAASGSIPRASTSSASTTPTA